MGLFGFGRKRKQERHNETELNDETQAKDEAQQAADVAAVDNAGNTHTESGATSSATGTSAQNDQDDHAVAEAEHDGNERGVDQGPWDVDDDNIPDYDDYLDIGALYLPYIEGISLRLKANQEDGSVVGANVSLKGASLEIEAFAAPKSQGLWDSVRADLLANNPEAKEVEGTFGTELMLPVHVGKQTVMTRVVGVDGPRWMLRGIFTGTAVHKGEMKKTFDQYLQDIVVNRGEEPLAPRDLIPMHGPITPAQRRKMAELQEHEGDDNEAIPPKDPDGPLTPVQQAETQVTLKRGPLFSEMR